MADCMKTSQGALRLSSPSISIGLSAVVYEITKERQQNKTNQTAVIHI